MGNSEHDPAFADRRPWNEGRKLGAKRALKPQQVWAIRFWLDGERRVRDRAMFDLPIDSKLRGCDVVKIRVGDLISGGRVRSRAIVSDRCSSCSKAAVPAPIARDRRSNVPGPSLVSEPKRLLASLLLACVGQSCVWGSYF
jgi:hypothetical protein